MLGVRMQMKFHYYKSAKRRGIEGILSISAFVLLLAGASFYMVFITQEPKFLQFLDHFVVWVLGIVIFILYWVSYRLYKSTDSWEIMVTETEVIWETPAAPGERSFQVKISEIAKAVCQEPVFSDSSDSYYLFLSNGEEIFLNHALAGLNINKFIKALEKSGVKYEYEKS